MLRSSRLQRPKRRWIASYAIAIVAIGIAVLLRILLQSFIIAIEHETPFLLLFAAVLVSGAFGGLGPGLLATVLAAGSSGLFFSNISYTDGVNAAEAMHLLLFLLEGVFISVLGARLQAARQRAESSEAEARQLEQEILDISDGERRRIGQDLHDGLGQHLTGVAFLSKALEQRLAGKALPEAADATKIAGLVSESIGQTRALARGLAPVGLEDAGLDGALSQLAASTSSVFSVRCNSRCDEDIESNDLSLATHLYRIAQEAIHNAVRHGKAKSIDVNLTRHSKNQLLLSIHDDGIGISPKPDHGGMGLQIMNFRARMIGGTLSVQRRPSGGTSVTCIAPIRSHA